MRTSFLTELLFPFAASSKFFIIIPIILSIIGILVNKKDGVAIRSEILSFSPIKFIIILLSLQICISFFHFSIKHVGASLLFLVNNIVFAVFIYSLLRNDLSKSQRGYKFFGLYNILIVFLTFVLIELSIVAPFSNDVSGMFDIFAGNVENGAVYYWPSWLSIQTADPRVVPNMGTLMGLTFEPHVFCFLFVPAFFFILADLKNRRSLALSLVFVAIGIVALLLSFSVTSFLALGFVMMFNTIKEIMHNRNYKYLFGLFIVGVIVLIYRDVLIESFVNEYVQNKLVENTGSLDYSSERFSALVLPTTLFGNGIMMYPFGDVTYELNDFSSLDVGAINTLFYVLFIISFFYYSVKLVFTKSSVSSLAGCGILYFFFHSFKLTNSVLVMPCTIYILCILYAYLKDTHHESITCNK